tara:strand:- start:830 stop:1117 length:288 start_codon:yes stop_codon:yes gene_type:complete
VGAVVNKNMDLTKEEKQHIEERRISIESAKIYEQVFNDMIERFHTEETFTNKKGEEKTSHKFDSQALVEYVNANCPNMKHQLKCDWRGILMIQIE